MATILEAAKTLLSVCDGARTLDGQGFNKLDSGFVRSIVERGTELTERQEQVIYNTLRKYQVQLKNHGIEYSDLEFVAKRRSLEAPITEEVMTLDYIDDPRLPLFKLRSNFDFRKQAKAIPGAYWHPEDKTWTYLPSVQFFAGIKPYLKEGIIKDTERARPILIELAKQQKNLDTVQVIKQQNPSSDSSMPCKIKPFSHQIKAYKIGTTVSQAALLMEQGTGKTLSAISIAGFRYLKGEIQKLLIICPLSVVSVWQDEFEKISTFKYEMKVIRRKTVQNLNQWEKGNLQVVVVNYESSWRILDKLLTWQPQMIIADESQKIKNGRAKQSKGLIKLGDQAEYKLILSGTPITQGPLDKWSQYRFLNPSIFGRKFIKFRDRYAIMGGYGGYQVLGYQNLPELAEKAHSIAYRVTKDEALDLPPQIDQIVKVELEPEARKIYDRMEKDFIVQFGEHETTSAPIILTQLLRLQQITGGFLPVDENEKIKSVSTAKLDMVEDLLNDLPATKKIIIFARFREEIKALKQLMVKMDRKYVSLTGETTDRPTVISAFQKRPEITTLIVQIQTGGLGITLTASDTVIFYSTTFSFADYEQAKARVHRIGQAHAVTYIHILAENTVDEEILRILKSKGNMAKLILDTLSRKFFKKPFTNPAERDILESGNNLKEDNSMTDKEETKTGPDKTADVSAKIKKIKATAEAKAPATAAKVKEKPEVKKNKVKAAAPATKKEKKVAKTQNPKLILLKDLAAEVGLEPREVRKYLRKNFKRKEGESWAWEKGDPKLAEIKKALKSKK
ncbi:MAG: DEAD/DEAH box helicase [bacterium]|nr:DEAD/DEAH box helicase [bacterium]